MLGLRDETDPAVILSIEPAQRGSLVHAVFETIAVEWLALEADSRPAWLQGAHLAAMHERAIEVLDELAADIGSQHRLGHQAAWAAERVKACVQPATWEAFWQTAVEGVRPKDVAERLGLTVANVYLARSRVMARIRAQLKGCEED